MKRASYSLLIFVVAIAELSSSRAWSQEFKPS